jgi:vancomycin resistance protein VanJ
MAQPLSDLVAQWLNAILASLPVLPLMRKKTTGAWVRAAISAALCAWVSTIYAARGDAFYAMTIWPPYVWAIPGLLVLLYRRKGVRGVSLWTPAAAWILFVGAFAEEPRSIVRGWTPEPARPTAGLRVVTLNCASEIAAAKEVARWKPDLVLLQESPSHADLVVWAKDLFGAEGAVLSGPDCSIVARGELVELDGSSRELNHVAALWMPPGRAAIKVVSLRLNPPVFRLDYWNPECWRDYARDRRERRAELQGLWNSVKSGDCPLLLAGDFNTPPDPGTFAPLSPTLKDCFAAAGRGWPGTAHNTWAFARIDQIWVGRGLKPVSSWAAMTANADHRMTVADVAW